MIQFYKPNAKMTGSACQFYLNNTNGFFSTLIKQASWDANRKTGSFSENKDNPLKNVIIKLSALELAGFIDAIERNVEFKGYHSSKQQVVQFNFGPYKKGDEQVGYSYSVSKQGKEDSTQKASFLIGLYFNEAALLKLHLQYLLDRNFNAVDDEFEDNFKRSMAAEKEKLSSASKTTSKEEDEIW